jgi:hypothetical protein
MIDVRPYHASQQDEWDTFVSRSNNGTIFHQQQFFNYHPTGRFTFHHLCFYESGRLIAVLPASITENGTCLESPVGASYGGLVLPTDLKYIQNEAIVDALMNYAVKLGLKKILLTPAPFIYQNRLCQDIDYALALRGFDFERHYISHAILLEPRENFISQFSATTRRYIHQCERNADLTIDYCESTKGYEEFYPILLDNKTKHNAKPTHSLEELIRLKELFPKHIFLFLVRYKGKAIGGSVMFLCNEKVSLCFYNMLYYEFEKLHPIHYVMHRVVNWSIDLGCRYVDIGVSQNVKHENQMTPAYSLIEYKEKFAAKGVLRSTFRTML